MLPSEFIRGLLEGDQHCDGTRCLTLFDIADLTFDRLCAEVDRYLRTHQASNVSDTGHATHWARPVGRVEQYSLLNRSGRSEDFSSDHDLSCRNKWFFDGDTFPVLAQWIADWPHLINFRLNVLHPGAALSAHEEHVPFRTKAGGVGARLRFHLPIRTNGQAELTLDAQVYQLRPGAVHLVNQGCIHAASNAGSEPRIHFVWDSLLTAELFAFLFEGTMRPIYLRRIGNIEAVSVRTEPMGPSRRLPSPLTAHEAKSITFCPPQ